MTYYLLVKNNTRYMAHQDFVLDAADVLAWMNDVRDDEPDLYQELVHVYFQLRKPL
jgi:hypothetical protein